MGQDANEIERQRRLAYRARVREWQSFLDTVGRRQGRIPPGYPPIPPPPSLFTDAEQAEAEAQALAELERRQAANREFFVNPPPFSEYFEGLTPQALARIISQNDHSLTPVDVYREMIRTYQQELGYVPYDDATLQAAAGITAPGGGGVGGGGHRGSWKLWDIYTFGSWEEALAFLRPQAAMLTRARRPVMVNAGGVLRSAEGARYLTHVDAEGPHGWANVEPSRLANSVVARAVIIQLEINAKFSRVEAVSLYIHK